MHLHWHLQLKAICFLRHLKPHIRNTVIYFFFPFVSSRDFHWLVIWCQFCFKRNQSLVAICFYFVIFLSFFAFSENKHSIKIKQLVVFHLRVNININNKQVFNFCNTTKTEKTRLKIPSIFFFQLLYFWFELYLILYIK